MPLLSPAVPMSRPARALRRGSALAGAALALGATGASAATVGGAEAGSSAVVRSASSAAAPAPASRATVRAAQRRLRVTADGLLGPQTRRALRRFQQRRGLRADGRLTSRALVALGVVGRTGEASPGRSPAPDTARVLEVIAACESGGDPAAVSADGRFRGKYQFLTSTWKAVGGTGDPAAAAEAEQDRRAAALLAAEGTRPWPVCGRNANSR